MKEIDEAIDQIEKYGLPHKDYGKLKARDTTLAALKTMKWIYAYPYHIALDTSDIKRKFNSYLKED